MAKKYVIKVDITQYVQNAIEAIANMYKIDKSAVDEDETVAFCTKNVQYWANEGAMSDIDQWMYAYINWEQNPSEEDKSETK